MHKQLAILLVTGLVAPATTLVFAQAPDGKPQRTIPSGTPTGIGMIDNPPRPLTPQQKAAAEKKKTDRLSEAEAKEKAERPASDKK
jgi:hypothetical protein